MAKEKYMNSPMGYTGNKYKLLPKLMPLFPEHVTHFYDVFCGGLTVALNVNAEKTTVSDVATRVIAIYKTMQNEGDNFLTLVDNVLSRFSVTPDNEAGYMALRDEYNKTQNSSVMLFSLIVSAYNSLVRFNSEGEYNAPFSFGIVEYNERKREVLRKFIDRIKEFEILNKSFDEVDVEDGSFVYCDPPYLITKAAYNEEWNHVSEYTLLRWLDNLHARGIKFGVSNVLRHKGKYNRVLDDWAKKYTVHHLDFKYNTYASGTRYALPTDEVYICNY